jgi:hypothetical protein
MIEGKLLDFVDKESNDQTFYLFNELSNHSSCLHLPLDQNTS